MKLKGFSLLELITCLSIVSALLWIALPFGHSMYQKNRAEVVTNEIVNAIQYAKNRSLSEGGALTLAPMNQEQGWSSGMVLFQDNPTHQPPSKDKIIHYWQWQYPNVSVIWKGFVSDNYLIISPRLNESASSGHFEISSRPAAKVSIVVNRIGHTRLLQESYLTTQKISSLIALQ